MFAEVWLSNLPRWSPSVLSPPDSITVTLSCMALQRQISADSSVTRTISRELCYRLHGTLVQSHYSNNYIGFRSSRGLCSRSLSSHSTCELSNSHSLLDNYLPSRNLRSEGQHLLRIPFRKSAAARRSFCFAAPTIWNSLKSSTRDATSIGTFKTRLKTELFNSAFQWTSTALLHCIRIVLGHYLLFFVETLQVKLTA